MDAFKEFYHQMSPFLQIMTSLIIIFVLPPVGYGIVMFIFESIYNFCKEIKERVSPSDSRLREVIDAESPRIKQLQQLNDKFCFHDIRPHYVFYKNCLSKPEFERTDLDEFFTKVSKQNIDMFQTYDKQIEENRKKYQEYIKEYSRLQSMIGLSGEKDSYKKMEQLMFDARKKTIEEKYEIIVIKKYSSPHGKNKYVKKKVFQREDVDSHIKRAYIIETEQEMRIAQIEHERSLMTASMRYDILTRDGHRCVICGATVADGVKLHVDHIIPVSKGGKTIPSNLRTLCDRCNLGKRDKYDPNGLN